MASEQTSLFVVEDPEHVATAAELCEHCGDLRLKVGAARAALLSLRRDAFYAWEGERGEGLDAGATVAMIDATLARLDRPEGSNHG